MPSDWLEKLVAPFAEADVMTVTGNILPYELEGESQLLFEVYGGLGRGFRRVDYAAEWFYDWYKLHAVPTWELGGTANAAFRATIFGDPQIGLMDEALGAGVPTGCSEDTYLFYKVAKAGYRIAYQATAHVWHKHRRSPEALRRQLYNYSKGHVAYHLTTWLRDGDARGLYRIAVELPFSYIGRAWKRLTGHSTYPLSLLAVELAGTLAGPLALWRSRRGVARAGRSAPYTAKSLPLRAPSDWMGASPTPRPLEVPEELIVAGS